ncbi:MAG: zinc ribbon domain-containing protein [Bacteroidota bacterium]
MSTAACASCGASLTPGADACDLCGTPLPDAYPVRQGTAVACLRCGNVPPPRSGFCNRCGAPMPSPDAVPAPAVASGESPASGERPASDVGKRAFAVAAAGLAAVLGLYALTALSGPPAPEPATAPEVADVGPAAAIPAGAPPLPDTLQAAADRFAAEGTASGWYESGRYYLTAAFNASTTDPTSSVRWARRAIEEFEQSLAIDDDPDVRFALAEAATFDPSNPMRPVEELQSILAAEPDHIGATLMLGERRLMIGRLDSARVALERVVALTAPGDPARTRAEEGLARVAQAGG